MMLQACRSLRAVIPHRNCIWELVLSIDARAPNPITRTFSSLNYKHGPKVILPSRAVRRHFSENNPRVGALEDTAQGNLKDRIWHVREQLSVLLREINVKLYENPVYNKKVVTVDSLTNDESDDLLDLFGEVNISHLIDELAEIEKEVNGYQVFEANLEEEMESLVDPFPDVELLRYLAPIWDWVDQSSQGKDDKEKRITEENLAIFVAQFDILIMNNEVEKAYEYFKKLLEDPYWKPFVEHIEIFDFLLRGFARRCEFSKIQEIWSLMNASNIQPTQNSYISVIQSFSNANPKNEMIKTIFIQVLEDLNQRGFIIGKALDEGVFNFDDRMQFIQTLKTFMNEKDISLQKSDSDTRIHISPANSQRKKYVKLTKLKPLVQSQIENELSCSIKIPSLCESSTNSAHKLRSRIAQLESNWRAKITNTLKERKRQKDHFHVLRKNANLNIFIYSIPISKLVDIIISSALKLTEDSETYSPSSSDLALQLGSEVMTSYHLHCKTVLDTTYSEEFKANYVKYLEWFCDTKTDARMAFENTTNSYLRIGNEVTWPTGIQKGVGKELLSLLLKEIHILCDAKGNLIVGDEESSIENPISSRHAFFKVHQPVGDVIKPNPSLDQLFSLNKLVDLRFSSDELPMVTPPLPSPSGYLLRSDPLVKIPQRAETETEVQMEDPVLDSHNFFKQIQDPVYDRLNFLGSIPWKINKDILNVASAIFVDGKDSSLLSRSGLPIHPDEIPPPVPSRIVQEILTGLKKPTGPQLQEYRDYNMKVVMHSQIKSESYSLWCDTLYQLSIANHFQENIIWFPHNLDFFPIPPWLNYMGNDLCRSLLQFAVGTPLRKAGFEWLKLHTVKLGGSIKSNSVEEGLLCFEEFLPEILDSANNPLNGRGWWLESDQPWQTLAACNEVRNALSHPGGPEKYVCHLRDLSLSKEYPDISSVYHLVLFYSRVCKMLDSAKVLDNVRSEALLLASSLRKIKDMTPEQSHRTRSKLRELSEASSQELEQVLENMKSEALLKASSLRKIKRKDRTQEQISEYEITRKSMRKINESLQKLEQKPNMEQTEKYHKTKFRLSKLSVESSQELEQVLDTVRSEALLKKSSLQEIKSSLLKIKKKDRTQEQIRELKRIGAQIWRIDESLQKLEQTSSL